MVFNFWTALSYKALIILMASVLLPVLDRRLPKGDVDFEGLHMPLAAGPR